MRLVWDLAAFELARAEVQSALEMLATRFDLAWELTYSDARPRVAVFASRSPHCLYDLLLAHQLGELGGDLVAVVSITTISAGRRHFGVRFDHIAVDPADKPRAEAAAERLLGELKVDLVVLARYMQILSPEFVSRWPSRIINIHHSFLPAFVGAKPYHQANDRGVKVIGATAHYVTSELDQGPIIEQDVARVSHRDDVDEMVRKGGELERRVLTRAVRLHLDAASWSQATGRLCRLTRVFGSRASSASRAGRRRRASGSRRAGDQAGLLISSRGERNRPAPGSRGARPRANIAAARVGLRPRRAAVSRAEQRDARARLRHPRPPTGRRWTGWPAIGEQVSSVGRQPRQQQQRAPPGRTARRRRRIRTGAGPTHREGDRTPTDSAASSARAARTAVSLAEVHSSPSSVRQPSRGHEQTRRHRGGRFDRSAGAWSGGGPVRARLTRRRPLDPLGDPIIDNMRRHMAYNRGAFHLLGTLLAVPWFVALPSLAPLGRLPRLLFVPWAISTVSWFAWAAQGLPMPDRTEAEYGAAGVLSAASSAWRRSSCSLCSLRARPRSVGRRTRPGAGGVRPGLDVRVRRRADPDRHLGVSSVYRPRERHDPSHAAGGMRARGRDRQRGSRREAGRGPRAARR